MSMHLSAFIDFVNIFTRYRSRHCTLQLLVMATEIVSTIGLYPVKKLFLQNENFNKIHKYLLKAFTLHTY